MKNNSSFLDFTCNNERMCGIFCPLKYMYSKCSIFRTIFFFLFSKEMLINWTGIHKMLVIIANREDPDHTTSSEAVRPQGYITIFILNLGENEIYPAHKC